MVKVRPAASHELNSYKWALWVIQHHLLGYAPLNSREVEYAFEILRKQEEHERNTAPST